MGGYTQADMPTYSGSFSGCFSLRQPDTHVTLFVPQMFDIGLPDFMKTELLDQLNDPIKFGTHIHRP